MNTEKHSILIVDDHEMVLRGMSQIIEEQLSEVDNIVTASTGQEAINAVNHHHFDVCIIDLELPDMSGFVLIDHVRQLSPESSILVNTIHDEIWTVKRLYDRHVEGIIFKSAHIDNFIRALRGLLDGGTYYDPAARSLISTLNRGAEEVGLSPREIDVLRGIADGENTNEIAKKLMLSANTIETHRRHLLEKLGARNSAEMVRRAIAAGILSTID